MSAQLLGLHRPGDTRLHRLGAGVKLLGLMVAGVVVVVVRGPVPALGFLAVAVALLAWSGARIVATVRAMRWLLLTAAVLGAWTVWQHDWPRAVEVVADLLALIALATTLTVTTPVDEVMDAVAHGLRPLRRVGVDPEQVALAFSLMLRAIPTTLSLAEDSRHAALARGLERSPRALLVPFVIRVVARARDTGDALHARGIGD
ncbi:energy-coupling factor transporter transmembrane component T [Nocardioides sp. SYSU D00065]|uniref:energy-coupling factor transporter transmembrane component T n=1 Tax=Nocardioides sp. SYSU D00065 TaxID=2817378 RepID=UPI001B32D6A7|nr:energy-coupling factor transporter transmembrane component T [Nocardioides sp. SYSU D00065]